MPVCGTCQRPNPDTHNFCSGCGGKLPRPLGSGSILEGRYEVKRVLSDSGGFATTYVVGDKQLFDRPFALKELRPEQSTPKAVDLFEREARVLAALDHPAIPKLHARFVENGKFYLVQEFIDGESWAERSGRMGPQTEAEVRKALEALLDILDFLHRQNPPIIHRDIKPANLMMDIGGSLHLIDFGAVREAVLGGTPGGGTVAVASTIIYTEGFAPPEQLSGTVTPACDLYAAGATALALLTARHPRELYDAVRGEYVMPVGLTAGFRETLERLLAYQIKERFSSARLALEALRGRTPQEVPGTWVPTFDGIQPVGQLLGPFQRSVRGPKPRFQWLFAPELEQGKLGNAASPITFDGSVFWVVEEQITSGFSYFPRLAIYALTQEGKLKWQRPLGDGTGMAKGLATAIPSAMGLLVHMLETAVATPWWVNVEGTENIGSEGLAHQLGCLDPRNGEVRWKTQLTERVGLQIHEGFAKTPPLLAEGSVWCGFANRICSLHPVDGTIMEALPLPEQVNGLHAVSARRAFVALGKFVVEAIDLVAPTPAKRWIFRAKTPITSVMVAPAGVAVGTKDGMMRVLDTVSGVERWSMKLGRGVGSPAAIHGNDLYVAAWDGKLYSLNAGTGHLRWTQSVPPGLVTSPAIVDGMIVVAADNEALAFDLLGGAKRWGVELPGRAIPGTSLLVRDDRIYVPTTAGLVALG